LRVPQQRVRYSAPSTPAYDDDTREYGEQYEDDYSSDDHSDGEEEFESKKTYSARRPGIEKGKALVDIRRIINIPIVKEGVHHDKTIKQFISVKLPQVDSEELAAIKNIEFITVHNYKGFQVRVSNPLMPPIAYSAYPIGGDDKDVMILETEGRGSSFIIDPLKEGRVDFVFEKQSKFSELSGKGMDLLSKAAKRSMMGLGVYSHKFENESGKTKTFSAKKTSDFMQISKRFKEELQRDMDQKQKELYNKMLTNPEMQKDSVVVHPELKRTFEALFPTLGQKTPFVDSLNFEIIYNKTDASDVPKGGLIATMAVCLTYSVVKK